MAHWQVGNIDVYAERFPDAAPRWFGAEEEHHALAPGTRVRIRAKKRIGSTARLNGLLATVIAEHPIANGWILIRIDENKRVAYRDWPIAAECVEPVCAALEAPSLQSPH